MNYEIILILLGISSSLSIIMSESWYDSMLEKLGLYFKPFICVKCMTFWLSIVFLLINGMSILIILSLSFINSYIGELLYRRINFM